MSSVDTRDAIKQALLEIRKLRNQLAQFEDQQHEPIAIVGMGCRFPGGVSTPDEFWDMLASGTDATREIPPNRWDVEAFYDPLPDAVGKMYTRRGGFLETIDQFDPMFFDITPREALTMDPQQRLLLEVAWEALENAGIAPDSLVKSKTGVFVGITSYDYAMHIQDQLQLEEFDTYIGTGNALNSIAGRLSYVLGLQGASVALDTACSSSLVTLHLACMHLRLGLCDMALAAGVNLIISPATMVTLSRAKMLAVDGRCKTFDANADGYGRGEGCGVVVLKRLSDAVANGDAIWAVVRGSAVNHDGPSSGLTVPNGQAQQALYREALSNAKVTPDQVSYIEAHGTGTKLGDPIELRSVDAVFGASHSDQNPLYISSVKTNMGHLEAAAGIAGVIKVALSLHHKQLAPHLNLYEPNPNVNWEKLSVHIPLERLDWNPLKGSRIAGVSSFGISGTNAHVILEQAPEVPPPTIKPNAPIANLVTFSVPNHASWEQLIQQVDTFLTRNPQLSVEDIAYTANNGRVHFLDRVAILANDVDDLREKMLTIGQDKLAQGVFRGVAKTRQLPPLAFLFTGQGSQYWGMGRDLLEAQPVFREELTRCANILSALQLEVPLFDVLFGQDHSLIDQTAYTQPALFAFEYALAKLWMSLGVVPRAVIGHSVGEVVAACLAGVFSLEDGLKLISIRSRLMQALPAGGKMVALFTDEQTAQEGIGEDADSVSVATLNGPSLTVISGAGVAVERIVERLKARQIRARALTVSHAFHSPLMQPMLDSFRAEIQSIQFHAPQIPIISNVSGKFADQQIQTVDYWVNHVLAPVRFADGMRTLVQEGYQAFVEVGPKPTLIGMARQFIAEENIAWFPQSSVEMTNQGWLSTVAQYHVQGGNVQFKHLNAHHGARLVRLPNTPYQRQRYWVEGNKRTANATPVATSSSIFPTERSASQLLGERIHSPLAPLQFTNVLHLHTSSLISEHVIHGMRLMPGIVWIQMGLDAMNSEQYQGLQFSLEKFVIHRPMIFENDARYTTLAILSNLPDEQPDSIGGFFEVYTLDEEQKAWNKQSEMRLRFAQQFEPTRPGPYDLNAILSRCTEFFLPEDFYQIIWQDAFYLGESFRCLDEIWRCDGEALGRLHLPEHDESRNVQPTLLLLDACVQLIIATVPHAERQGEVFVGLGQEFTRVYRPFQEGGMWCQAILHPLSPHSRTVTGSLYIFGDDGELICEFGSVSYSRANKELLAHSLKQHLPNKTTALNKNEATQERVDIADATAVENVVVSVVSAVVGIPTADLDRQRPMVEMIDSLMSIEIKNQLESRLKVDVPLSQLLGGSSIIGLVEWLGQVLHAEVGVPTASEEDSLGLSSSQMQQLAVLPSDIVIAPTTTHDPLKGVMLTGATGFVGAYLLAELLRQTDAIVYCLVRADDEDHALDRLQHNLAQYNLWDNSFGRRIEPVLGDLSLPYWGLDRSQFDALANAVQMVWHNGAVVKWTYPYESLSKANVFGTQEAIRFAATGVTKPLHFVSTVGVFASNVHADSIIDETIPLHQSGNLHIGYAQTKWVAESIVRQAGASGLPVTIYRINTGGDSVTGVYNSQDYFRLIVQGCLELGMAPAENLFTVQAVPIDFATQAMVRLSLMPVANGKTYHIVNNQGMTWQEVVAYLRQWNDSLLVVSFADWLAEIDKRVKHGETLLLAGLLPFLAGSFGKETILPAYKDVHAKEDLSTVGMSCPPFDATLLQKYVAHFVKSE